MEYNLLTYNYDPLSKAKEILGDTLFSMVDEHLITTTFHTFDNVEEYESWLDRQQIIGNFRLGAHLALRKAAARQEKWSEVCMQKCIKCGAKPVSYDAYYYEAKKLCNVCNKSQNAL